MRQFWILVLFFSSMSGLNFLCHRATDGYFPYRLSAKAPTHTTKITEAILLQLDQPYRYLGKGHQCFVFESDDGNAIIKFPFHAHTLPPFWMRPIPLLSDFYRAKKMQQRGSKHHRDDASYLIAFEQLRDETGVCYLHLHPTEGELPVIPIYDKIGVKHLLPLDQIEFILQKKGEEVFAKIDHWIDNGQLEMAKQGLSALIALFAHRYAQGIEDREYVLQGNYGFCDEKAMQIDIGRLRILEAPLDQENQANAIWSLFEPLTAHLEKRSPELANYLAQKRFDYLLKSEDKLQSQSMQ